MKAIETKYLGPTDTKGSRVTASDGDGTRVTLAWYTSGTSEGNHERAATALCQKMGWKGSMLGGHTKGGMTWVFDSKHSPKLKIPA